KDRPGKDRPDKEHPDKERQKLIEDYQNLMRDAATAVGAKKSDDAIKTYAAAMELAKKLFPENTEAAERLGQARAAQAAQVALEQERKGEFDRLMQDGAFALGRKKYEDAITAYQAALKLFPGDSRAEGKLREAREERDAQTTTQKDDPKRKEEVTKLLAL